MVPHYSNLIILRCKRHVSVARPIKLETVPRETGFLARERGDAVGKDHSLEFALPTEPKLARADDRGFPSPLPMFFYRHPGNPHAVHPCEFMFEVIDKSRS